MTLDDIPGLRFSQAAVNGVNLRVAEAGQAHNPLVILLHGFPEFWYGWRGQIGVLAAAGFHVAAPDQRGYGGSSKPHGIGAYRLDTLAADIAALATALGHGTFGIAGHDWGALVAWWTAAAYPARVTRLVAINGPHPSVMREVMARDPVQRRKSWYVRFFQIPGLPELALRLNRFAVLRRALSGAARRDAFSKADLARYIEAWSQPGALRGMIGWYRALQGTPMTANAHRRIACPTLVLWGVKDRYLQPEMASASLALCDDGHLVRFPKASHWLLHDEPEAVNRHLIAFFRGDGQ